MTARLPAVFGGLCALLCLAPSASAGTAFIERVAWVGYHGLATLRVYPTAAGRDVAGDPGKTSAEISQAWSEVLALAPDADTPGMREQFRCHWNFAEFAAPGKKSWDLEPWRPAVDEGAMVLSGCNPGGAEWGQRG